MEISQEELDKLVDQKVNERLSELNDPSRFLRDADTGSVPGLSRRELLGALGGLGGLGMLGLSSSPATAGPDSKEVITDQLKINQSVTYPDGTRITTSPGQGKSPNKVVRSTNDLKKAFDDLSTGDYIYIQADNAPYEIDTWLDVRTKNVLIEGEHPEKPLIKVADRANVGGIRVGPGDRRVRNVRIHRVGIDGNHKNQDQSVKRLHNFIVQNAEHVIIDDCYGTRASPDREHQTGGSGITVRHQATFVRVEGCRIHDPGDRGIQIAGEQIIVKGNRISRTFDRHISLDVGEADEEGNEVRYLTSGSIIALNTGFYTDAGSSIGCNRQGQRPDRGHSTIVGNSAYGKHGSLITLRGGPTHLNIVGNVGHNSRKPGKAGILMKTGKSQAVGNMVRNYNAGIITNGPENAIVGNRIHDVREHGISTVGWRLNSVVGNIVRGAGKYGIYSTSGQVSVVGNSINKCGGPGIRIEGSGIVSNNLVYLNHGGDRGHVSIDAEEVSVIGNRVNQHNQGGAAFQETEQADHNVFIGNHAVSNPWNLKGPNTVVENNGHEFDRHRDLEPAGGTVSVDFRKPYAEKPFLLVTPEQPVSWGVEQWTSDDDDNYTGVVLRFIGENGAANPTVHVAVRSGS